MDPTKFCPTWNKQGTHTRRYLVGKTYEDVEDALYVRGIAAVYDLRKVLDIIYSTSPCTPIAEFME